MKIDSKKRPEPSGNSSSNVFSPNKTYKEEIFSEEWKRHRPAEYFDYRRQWDEVPRTKTELDFPIHLDIETTNLCNLLCPMCPRTIMVERDEFAATGRMTRAQYKSIIDQGVAHGVKSVKLNYLGEPLLHKDVAWQVEYAKKNGVIDVMMNTNATALTEKVGTRLLEAGIDNIFVSFDAVSPHIFEQQRVGTTLGRVIDNVYNFVKIRNKNYPGVQIRLSMVMYNEPMWLEQFESLKVMWRGLVDSVGYGFYTERDPDLRGDYQEVEGFWCAQPFQRMFLKFNGNVTMCCVDDRDEVVHGNWHKDSLYDIWNGPSYKALRKAHAESRYYDVEFCRKCYLPISD